MKVSVLVCSYGDREWERQGRRALDSIEGQGAHEAFALHYPNGTLAEVRNAAAAAASGEWLCFLDCDDELCPGYLDAMRAAWEREWDGDEYSSGALLVPAVQEVDPQGGVLADPKIPAWGKPLIEINCAVIGTLVPRVLFTAVGGFHEWPIYEDWDLWLRCVAVGALLVPVVDAVYCAHVNLRSRNRQGTLAKDTYWAIRREHERST